MASELTESAAGSLVRLANPRAAADLADLEDTEWPLRASQLAAVIAWTRGRIDRAGFRRWLRSEGWPEEDLDDLTPLLEHIFATDQRMPHRGSGGAR